MIFSKRQVLEGECLPWGYGRAYYMPQTDAMVCYPVPFNLAVRWLRNLYYWLANPRMAYKEKYEAVSKSLQESHERYWKLRAEYESLLDLFGRANYLKATLDESKGGKHD